MFFSAITKQSCKHITLACLLLSLVSVVTDANALPLPDEQKIFSSYLAGVSPLAHTDPAIARPIAIGSAAQGGNEVNLTIQLDKLDAEADLYFGFSSPSLNSGKIHLINQNGELVALESGLPPWKTSVDSINASVFDAIPVTEIPAGSYTFYLLLTAKDQSNPLQGNFYLWQSEFHLPEDKGLYVAPGNYGSYPANQQTIQGWIDRLDTKQIRAHAWDIWGSITANSGIDSLPVWETWFSGYEIFELAPQATAPLRDFEQAKQFNHAQIVAGQDIPINLPESLTAFNRYTKTLADYIIDHGYNELSTLETINDNFNTMGTAVVDRQILTSDTAVDSSQIVLKPVFQFISSSEPTAIPYWSGVAPSYTTNLNNPEPKTWRQGVVVDPTGNLMPGTTVMMSVNDEPPQPLPVVSLDDFYYIVLTEAEANAFLDDSFGFGSGDDVGENNETSEAALRALVKEGNIALLMAMHVTTKEISNWTWQTFWWAGNPKDILYGNDRPHTIGAPWNHYNMPTAYYMVSPANTPGGDPLISFNPYLETNLQGTVPGPNDTQISWTGVHSNCMSCHRMAGYKTQGYQPNGLINPGDVALFGEGTKTDFLWSIPIRAYSPTD